MRTTTLLPALLCATLCCIISCQQEAINGPGSGSEKAGKPTPPTSCNPNAYVVELVGETFTSEGYEWVWRIMNPNPGNGSGGTSQALSHWGFQLCETFDTADLVSTSHSFDNVTWSVPETAVYQPDASQPCQSGPVIKFNAGTVGSAWTYFKLIVSANYNIAVMNGYYKSGAITGCCTFTFQGIGCIREEGCSLSQGYWFANDSHAWPDVNGAAGGNLTLGGHNYTETEGRAIWNTSNAGGIPDTKAGFLQAAAIILSQVPASNTSVWDDVAIISNELAQYSKLAPGNLPHPNAIIKAAAGRISDWIEANHCE